MNAESVLFGLFIVLSLFGFGWPFAMMLYTSRRGRCCCGFDKPVSWFDELANICGKCGGNLEWFEP